MSLTAASATGSRYYFYSFSAFCRNSYISRTIEVLVYAAVIRPVMAQASEIQTLTMTDEEIFGTCERKIY